MAEKEKDAPGFIWLCFVNWVNTLENAQSFGEDTEENPQKPSIAEFLKK